MTSPTDDRFELIQRYVDQTMTDEELSVFQDMLKNDTTMREAFLLYVRMDVAIQDYVLFHNYMDADFKECIADEAETAQVSTSQQQTFYQKILASLFPEKKLQ